MGQRRPRPLRLGLARPPHRLLLRTIRKTHRLQQQRNPRTQLSIPTTSSSAKIDAGLEARVHFTNYRKDGSPFTNILTLIPITWDGRNYIVGFQADKGMLYR